MKAGHGLASSHDRAPARVLDGLDAGLLEAGIPPYFARFLDLVCKSIGVPIKPNFFRI